MSASEKGSKNVRIIRQKAMDFLSSRRNSECLMEICSHFSTGQDLVPCIQALDTIFTTLLKNREMYVEVVPLRGYEDNAENKYRDWLQKSFEECFNKIIEEFDNNSDKVQTQALQSAMNLISYQGKYPFDKNDCERSYFMPLAKLKSVLMKILSSVKVNTTLINKFAEFLIHEDVQFHVWRSLLSLTAKTNPNEIYVMNYLLLLHKLHVQRNNEAQLLCSDNQDFDYDLKLVCKALNKVWAHVMVWEHSASTHKQLLIVLLENVISFLEKPLLLTDFLMDSLDVGGPVSLLALQGIFTLIQVHNLDYPNIYGKLYSMFEPEIFHTKYKARLFYLSDLFLSSTHLPESLVAAFVKRLARLTLVAPSEDIIIICMFIGNLILRHPGLKCLINNPAGTASSDPFIMDERDPLKSNAINSSLWELKSLQSHIIPNVADAARFINSPLPSIEWDMANVLEDTSDDIFDKEIKRNKKLITLQFEKPSFNRCERTSMFWDL